MPRGSADPAAIGVQRPIDAARPQLRHGPVQAWSQHTPSTQWLCWHSASPVQIWPACFGPQVLLTHAMPVSQSALVAQVLVQAPLAHRNGWQSWMPWPWHVPRPSHVPAVFTLALPEQVGAMQTVSRGYFEQPPMPSQKPVGPQLDLPWSRQMPRLSGASASSGQQRPSRPARLHERHGPLQATLQQILSAQKPEAHWSPVSQLAPLISLPQLPWTQAWPLMHWLLDVHDVKHAPALELHVNGTQMRVDPGLQCPTPSHTDEPTTASPSHVPGLHIVFSGYLRQAPAP